MNIEDKASNADPKKVLKLTDYDGWNDKTVAVVYRTLIERIAKLLIGNGFGASDERGHSSTIKFSVHPAVMEVLAGVTDQLPPDAFKYKADIHRAIFLIGCDVIAHIFSIENQDVSEWRKVITDLHAIRMDWYRENIRKKALELSQDVFSQGGESTDEVIEKIRALNQRFNVVAKADRG